MVEDIHWSDPATRDLVTFLVRNLDAERLLLVLTIRTDDVSRSHPATPWIAELLRAPSAERIDLERLAIDESDAGRGDHREAARVDPGARAVAALGRQPVLRRRAAGGGHERPHPE